MKDIVNKGQVLAQLIYAFYGIAIIAGIFFDNNGFDSFALATLFFWGVTLCILIAIRLSDLRHSFAYNALYIMSVCVFAVLLQLCFTSIFIVFIVFAILWLSVITFLDKRCFHFTIFIQTCCVVFLLIIPREYSGLADFNITSLIFSLVGFMLADMVGNIIINMLIHLDEETHEHEQSLDDMLEIVETKNHEARSLTKAKSDFLSTMSHELRTPLNAVIGFDEMILRTTDDSEIVGYAKDIKNAGQMMLSLVNDILDLSKIESDRMVLLDIDFDLNSVVNDVVNMIEPKMQEKNLKFIVNVDPELSGVYRGDDVRIKQILVNLLNNAAKYTLKGSVALSITGKKNNETADIRVSVKDTGIGIKDEDLAKLNEKFVRIEEEKNRNIEGTGLGISIVNSFLLLMNSNLCVESKYGEGSEFYFTLTLPISTKNLPGGTEKVAKDEEQTFKAEDMEVLIVDDTLVNLRVARALLRKNKVNVDTADSGAKAIEMAKEKKYDVIFLDRMMPEMDGLETLKNMKAIENFINADTPVVALTADAVGNAKEAYISNGFDDYIAKPIVPAELERILRQYYR